MYRLDLKTGVLAEWRPGVTLVDLIEGHAPLPVEGGGPLVLRVGAQTLDEDVAGLIDRAVCIEIVARDFKDGRVASLTRHLRRHHRYGAEIVISGPVIPQMADLLRRVGADAVLLADPDRAGHWRAALNLPQVWLQFATDARPTVMELRHRRSRRDERENAQ